MGTNPLIVPSTTEKASKKTIKGGTSFKREERKWADHLKKVREALSFPQGERGLTKKKRHLVLDLLNSL